MSNEPGAIESREITQEASKFESVISSLSKNLPPDKREEYANQRDGMIQRALEAGYLDIAIRTVPGIIRNSEWDFVYSNLLDNAEKLEVRSQKIGGLDITKEQKEEWKGMVRILTEGSADQINMLGIEKKATENKVDVQNLDETWKSSRGYDNLGIERMRRSAEIKRGDILLPEKAAQLVGEAHKKKQETTREDINSEQIKELLQQNRDILEAFQRSQINYNQFISLSQKQAAEARERYARVGPLEERRRWADAAFEIDFYQRFSPNVEPNFYTQLDPERRKRFDSLWQVARAAYVRKALSSFPEKYKENSDLQQFGKEQEETVWNTPSFKDVLRGQARSVKYSEKITVKGYGDVCIWDCSDMKMFNSWRMASAMTEINRTHETQQTFKRYVEAEAMELYGIDRTDIEGLKKVAEILLIENSAAAFGILSMFAYIESKHTRYGGVESTSGLPGAVESGDFRGIFHPQERYEGKMNSKQNWGQFSLWGITQMHRIDRESGKKQNEKSGGNDYYEYHFTAADRKEYWTWRELPILASNTKKAGDAISRGGRVKVIEVRVPECHPITTCKSYLEDPKIEDKILNGENLEWNKIGEDDVVVWLFSKFNKGVQLVEYFNPGKPIEPEKSPFWGLAWAKPLEEILDTRLEIEKVINTVQITSRTYQTYDKLKAWLVFAGTGGIDDPNNKRPTFNRTLDPHIIGGHLSSRRARALFLKNWKQLFIIR